MTGVTNERYLHKDLNAILKRLGTTKSHLLLFTAGPGDATALVPAVSTASVLYQTKDETGTVNVNAEFGPLPLPCGLWAYHFGVAGNNHIAASADSTEHSYGDGSADEAFSLGAWILPSTKSDNTLIAKYDATAAEEFKWGLAATSGALYLELYDASANASEIGTADGSQTKGAYDGSPALHEWSFVCTTYDGTAATPTIRHYINGVDVSNADADSVESSTYTALENGATPLLFGASELTAGPAEEYHGHMALPFVTGKELSATEVLELFNITRSMVLGK
jgi:hypothetical protein